MVCREVAQRNTRQGYAHESAWARGQAWGLYGFILEHPNLPADKVPYWDFDAPGQPDIPRDVSAAAVLASGLYELILLPGRERWVHSSRRYDPRRPLIGTGFQIAIE